jgi:hypothetical protein
LSVTGLPDVRANTIVRDRATGAAWLVGSDRFRRWIPTGGDYECLVARGAQVWNMTLFEAKSIPEDYTSQARCTLPPPRECASVANSYWEGTHIDPDGNPWDLTFSFDENGSLNSYLGFDVHNVVIDCDSIDFDVDSIAHTSGTFDAERQHVTGTWTFIGASEPAGSWSADRVS